MKAGKNVSKKMIGCFVILFIVLVSGCFMIRKLTRKTKKKFYNDISKEENEELVKFIRENSEDEEFARFVEKTLEDSDKLIDIKIEKDDK